MATRGEGEKEGSTGGEGPNLLEADRLLFAAERVVLGEE
jgi:hypothetical protein